MAELERAEAVPETPRNQGQGFPVQRVLIVIGVVVAAAVFGRARGDENRRSMVMLTCAASLIHRNTAYPPFERRRPMPWSRSPDPSNWIKSHRHWRLRSGALAVGESNRQTLEHRRLPTAILR